MKRLILVAALVLVGCKTDADSEPARAEIRLVRAGGSMIEVTLSGASVAPRAVQIEVEITSQSAYLLETVSAPPGLALDTLRLQMRGTNRAILFAGDKRGVRMPRDGVVARFTISTSGAPDPTARIAIAKALVAGADGALPVDLGAAISLP